MKKIFRLMCAAFFAAGLSVAFTACEPETEVTTGVITFEDVVLDSTGYFIGSDGSGCFRSGILTSSVDFANGYWTGFACSNHTNMDSIGWGNQYSVYATSGAGGSSNFALIYSYGPGATTTFNALVEVKSLMFNNSTYTYWAMKEGMDGTGWTSKFSTGDYFFVTVTGYDSAEVKTGDVKISLADFTDSKSYICSEWTKISLESLGNKVKSLTFTFESSDPFAPTYICIDNIEYIKK